MQVSVNGQHISLGEALQSYVKERAQTVVEKYFDNTTKIHVHFAKQNFEYQCDILLDGAAKHRVRSNAKSDDVYSAFDTALLRLEKQLRKYKSKLKDRGDKVKLSSVSATKYVINPYHDHDIADNENSVDNPVIVAEKPTTVMTLSVGEAVMQMDLENLPALMFKNSKNNRINVVYHRNDGNISWVDYHE